MLVLALVTLVLLDAGWSWLRARDAEMRADVARMVLDVGAERARGWLLREMLASSRN